jgi:hypothetical protein
MQSEHQPDECDDQPARQFDFEHHAKDQSHAERGVPNAPIQRSPAAAGGVFTHAAPSLLGRFAHCTPLDAYQSIAENDAPEASKLVFTLTLTEVERSVEQLVAVLHYVHLLAIVVLRGLLI